MKKFLTAAASLALLAACASAPIPAPAPPKAAAPAPAPAAAAPAPAPREVKIEEALPVSVKSFYPNGDPSSTVTTKYTAAGLLLSQETLNGNGVLTESRSGKVKGAVWRITVTNAQSGEITSFEDRTVSPAGQLLVQTFLNAKEVPQATNEFAYDREGRKILWTAKTGAGELQAKTTYSYDANGNNGKTEVYDAGGKLSNIFESTFDEAGKISVRKGFDAAKNLVEQTSFTWKDGRKVKEETTKPILRTIEYSYGDKAAPTGIVSSVRGKVVERQTLDYLYITRILTVAP